jgi:hypothetical protein
MQHDISQNTIHSKVDVAVSGIIHHTESTQRKRRRGKERRMEGKKEGRKGRNGRD